MPPATAVPLPVAAPAPTFTAAERALVRYAFLPRFGQAPRLADGVWLRTWKSGPLKDRPKLPPALAGMQERGLVEVVPGGPTPYHGHRAVFTEAGLVALRLLAQDRRALDPGVYAHLRRELGITDGEGAATVSEGATG